MFKLYCTISLLISLALGISISEARESEIHTYVYDDLGHLITDKSDSDNRHYFLDSESNVISVLSPSEIIKIDNIDLFLPSDDISLDLGKQQEFSWRKLPNVLYYDIYLGRQPNKLLRFKSGIQQSRIELALAAIHDANPVYWQVVGTTLSNKQVFSGIRTFSALDTDGDELPDHVENRLCSSYQLSDSDHDGLIDSLEWRSEARSDPCSKDGDFDGIDDAFEFEAGLNPTMVDSHVDGNWKKYVEWVNKRDLLSGIQVKQSDRVLDLRDGIAYVISGIVPDNQPTTMMFWMKADELTGLPQSSGSHDDSNRRFYAGVDEHNQFIFGVGNKKTTLKGATYHLNEWVHLAVAYEEKEATLYVNGKKFKTLTSLHFRSASNYALWFGSRHHKRAWESHGVNGVMDNIQVWNKRLSEQEIKRFMLSLPEVSDESLLAFYDFTENRGEWVKNRATGQFDLKLAGGAKLTERSQEKDSDQDGILDSIEQALCTSSEDVDTDNDGISDGYELGVLEVVDYITDPCNEDTDNDAIPDGFEAKYKMNLIEHDTTIISEGNTGSYWSMYSREMSQQENQVLPIINQKRHFDLTEIQGYGVNGYAVGDSERTLMYWLKVDDTSKTNLSGVVANNHYSMYFGINHKRITGNGPLSVLYEEADLFVQQWHHLAVSQKENKWFIYLDGQLISVKNIRLYERSDLGAFWLGAVNNYGQAKSFVKGKIDDFQIWDIALNQQQIRRYMTSPPKLNSHGLKGWYNFDVSRGDWVKNEVTGQFDMQLKGGKLTPDESSFDSDLDGIFDRFEIANCLNPEVSDTDGDGISDGIELGIGGKWSYITDPCSSDTDGDGIPDRYEQENGTNPLVISGASVTSSGDNTQWQQYAKDSQEKLITSGVQEVMLDGELNLLGHQGYAISGFSPKSPAMSFMYWVKLESLERTQLSGLYLGDKKVALGYSRVGKWINTWRHNKVDSTYDSDLSTWVHVAFTVDGNENHLYINGELTARRDFTLSLEKMLFLNGVSSHFWVGALNNNGQATDHIEGYIDDVQIWTTSLSQGQVRQYMVTAPIQRTEGLAGYYDFSFQRGNWIKNLATEKYDMLLVNNASISPSTRIQDSDLDGLSDSIEADLCTDLNNFDSDGDGLSDGVELGVQSTGDGVHITNPCDIDTDKDAIFDGFEIKQGMNPNAADGYVYPIGSSQTHWQNFINELPENKKINKVPITTKPQQLDVTNGASFAITGVYPGDTQEVTFSYWFKLSKNKDSGVHVLSGVYDKGYRNTITLGLGYSWHGARASWQTVYKTIVGGKNKFQNREWVHLALSLKDGQQTLYVNGHQVEKEEDLKLWHDVGITPLPLTLGALRTKGLTTNVMNGWLDNVAIWATALDQQDIRRYMFQAPDSNSVGLRAYYDFNSVKGSWVLNKVTDQFDLYLSDGAMLSPEPEFSDLDNDGLWDQRETDNCLSPDMADSDGDGIIDGNELGKNTEYQYITNPCDTDSDNDGIDDLEERLIGSNPLLRDSYLSSSIKGKNNWLRFAEIREIRDQKDGVEIVTAPQVLDLRDNLGYSHTNYYPSTKGATIMYWMKPDNFGGYGKAAFSGLSTSSNHFLMGYISNSYVSYASGSSSKSKKRDFQLDLQKWIHFALTINPNETALYVNGVKYSSYKTTVTSGNENLAFYIGALNRGGIEDNHIDGIIDDVHIWNRSLNGHEVRQRMFMPPSETDQELVASYDFNQVRGEWVRNNATGIFDLRLMNGALLDIEESNDDTDGDSLPDRFEYSFCSDALLNDTDGDGLSDGSELGVDNSFVFITHPCIPDTDKDGMTDGFERLENSDGASPDANFDSDDDGQNNWNEYANYASENLVLADYPSGVLDNTEGEGYAITPLFPDNSDVTYMYWMRTDSDSKQGSGVNVPQQTFYFWSNLDSHYLGWGGYYGAGYSRDRHNYTLGEWTHIAYTVTGNNKKIYINGERLDSDTYQRSFPGPSHHAFWLGAINELGKPTYPTKGLMHDPYLVAYYDFSQVKGNWVLNKVNNRFDMKLVGEVKVIDDLQVKSE